MELTGNFKTIASIQNIEIISHSFQSSAYSFSGIGTLNLWSLMLSNISEFRNPSISIDDALFYSQTGSTETSFIIDNITISSVNMNSYSTIDISSMPNIAIINSQFSDIVVGSENYLVSLDSLYGFKIQNCNFTNIIPSVKGDSSNKMIINLVSLNESQSSDLLIDNFIVDMSELSFFVLERVTDTENTIRVLTYLILNS